MPDPKGRLADLKGLAPNVALAALGAVVLYVAMTSGEVHPPGASPAAPMQYPPGSAGGRLEEYVQRDFEGLRLERASWAIVKDWVVWTAEPAWDAAYVVRSYRLRMGKPPAAPGDTLATSQDFEVLYDTLGELDLASFGYVPSPSRQAPAYTVVNERGGWRLGVPLLKPHVGAEGAIAFLTRMRGVYTTRTAIIDQSIARIRQDAAATPPP